MTGFNQEQHEWARSRESRAQSRWAPLLVRLYRFTAIRSRVLSFAARLEGGIFFSSTLREILRVYHGVVVGRYSYGPCLVPGVLPPGTKFGAYCSVAEGLSVHRRNHPVDRLTQHPFFYNAALGLLRNDSIPCVEDNPLEIGHDVWIGDRVTILPGCRRVGNGAVIAAGSIVTRDVEAYAVVAGIPAKPIRLRYPQGVAEVLEATRWWERTLPELMVGGELLFESLTPERTETLLALIGGALSGGSQHNLDANRQPIE